MDVGRKIKTVVFNWYATSEVGEEFQKATVGEQFAESMVSYIEERKAERGAGRYYYDIHLENGEMVRVFNPNTVLYAAQAA